MARTSGGWSRRRLIQSAGVAGAALLAGCAPLPGQAPPPPARMPRIGFLGDSRGRDDFESFREGLRDLGYVEGQNVLIEYRATDQAAELPALAAELVALPIDVFVAGTLPHTQAAREATSTIPIVFVFHPDPVGAGHVASLARPGGNATGMSFLGTPLGGKRLDLLRQAIPGLARVAVLSPTSDRSNPLLVELDVAAAALGLELQVLAIRNAEDVKRALQAAIQERAQALTFVPAPVMGAHGRRIRELAAEHYLPAIGYSRGFAAAGHLMAYGPDATAIRRRAAYYVDRILKGANPADLPVEQPHEFEFVINLGTARALGLTIPESVLVAATEVIP